MDQIAITKSLHRVHETLLTELTQWTVVTDEADNGRADNWFRTPPASRGRLVAVPGYLQEAFPGYHGLVWFWTRIPWHELSDGQRCLLRFDRVSYAADIWLNGEHIGHNEGTDSFEVDLSAQCSSGVETLVVVRVLNPTTRRIDGVVLSEMPAANAAEGADYRPGRGYNYGGITGPVRLVTQSKLALEDLLVTADPERAEVRVRFHIANHTNSAAGVRWQCEIAAEGAVVSRAGASADAPVGGVWVECRLPVSDPVSWSPNHPYLYDICVLVTPTGDPALDAPAPIQTQHLRTGFRTFAVDEGGFFVLNRQRVFVRSTHTGNHVPAGLPATQAASLLHRDLLNAKAVGLNMVRFIACRATPEQLDACDEIGLMVYEECAASWPHGYSSNSEERFDVEMGGTVRRDRNHPSVVIWGLLNETKDGPNFRHAVAALQLVRDLDPTRLVLLGSGRWDGDVSIGSVCNPGSSTWEHRWGTERPDGATVELDPSQLGYVPEVGDRHLYPTVPHTREANTLLRTMGAEGKPVFLSEYGIGSLFNVVAELKSLRAAGAAEAMAEPSLMRSMNDRFQADFHRFGLASVYAFPEDLLDESYRAHARYRLAGIGLLRSNPQMAGHNITGMLDHAVSGEGMWSFAERVLKPGIVDAVGDAFAPLRWCVYVDPEHSVVGQPVTIDITLADEGVLAPGTYPGTARLMGADGPEWESSLVVEVPAPRAARLVHPVLRAELPTELPAGRHDLLLSLDQGGSPRGRRTTLIRSSPVGALQVDRRIVVVGDDHDLVTWLGERGVAAAPEITGAADTILIGAGVPTSKDTWRAVSAAVNAGATAVLLDARCAVSSDGWLAHPIVPLGIDDTEDWLYHTETIARPHPALAGIADPGLLDWSFFGQTIPRSRVTSSIAADDVAVVQIGIGMPVAGGYVSGYGLSGWTVGNGRLIANTLRLVECLGTEPAAALLLAGVVRWTGQ
ncbi:MAG: glycoside hydrolase family 2 TIM barrel-domain containing protein [Jatrophihabitans sp.]